jgi:predicted alpha/beta hydrolase family esterase
MTSLQYQDPIIFVAHSLGGIIVKDVRLYHCG